MEDFIQTNEDFNKSFMILCNKILINKKNFNKECVNKIYIRFNEKISNPDNWANILDLTEESFTIWANRFYTFTIYSHIINTEKETDKSIDFLACEDIHRLYYQVYLRFVHEMVNKYVINDIAYVILDYMLIGKDINSRKYLYQNIT